MNTIITNSVKKAASFIKNGEVTAFPTETVYGLGADAYNEKAVKKIYKIKGRPSDNPLIVHIAYKKDISVLASEITEQAKKIIKQFFPGPATVILKKNEVVPDVVTAGLNTIAIRMPSSVTARNFIKACGVPIAAPSANISGSPSPTSYFHVLQDFHGKIPCMLTGKASKYGLESTVIDCTGKHPVILRPGSISLEQLKKLDPETRLQKKTLIIKSPGQKYRHYSPKADVRIITKQELRVNGKKRGTGNSVHKYGFIGIGKYSGSKFTYKKLCGSIEEYARNLFSFLRECDEKGIDVIYCEKVSEKGIGLAVMNRLKKAAGKYQMSNVKCQMSNVKRKLIKQKFWILTFNN